jgi:hypothetical protein
MARLKTPLKKVRIQTNRATQTPSKYEVNQRRLSFLPAIFLVFVVVAGSGASVWFYDPFNWHRRPAEVAGVQEVVNNLPDQNATTQTIEPVNTQTTSAQSSQAGDERNIRIQNANNQDCFLSFAEQAPLNVNPITSSDKTGWWLPNKCADPSILAIQILRLNQESASNLEASLGQKNVQKLDDIDTFALVYTQNRQTSIYNLEPYVKTLTWPVFQDRYYFNEAAASSTIRMSDVTYYLDGKCRGGGSEPCKLWRRNNTAGQLELLKKNLADTGPGGANQLQPGLYLDFASLQDYDYGLNLVLVDQNSGNYQLIRVRMPDYQIIQSLTFKPEDRGFKAYFK